MKLQRLIFLIFCCCVSAFSLTEAIDAPGGKQGLNEDDDTSQGRSNSERLRKTQITQEQMPTRRLTDRQLRFDAVDSASATIQYLRRKTVALSSKARHLGSKVGLLEKWKAATDDRMERLENMFTELLAEQAGNTDHNGLKLLPQNTAPDDEDTSWRDLLVNDGASYETEGLGAKKKRGADARPKSSDSEGIPVHEESEIDQLSNAVMKLNKTVGNRGRLTYKIYTRVGRNERYMVRRFSSLELKLRRTQRIAERALSSIRAQNSKLEATTEDVEIQKRSLDTLRSEVSRGEDKNTIAIMQRRLKEMKVNMTEKMLALEEEIGSTTAAVSSLSFLMTEQLNITASTESQLLSLQKTYRQENIALARNISRINKKRFARKDRQFALLRTTVRFLTEDISSQQQATEDIAKTLTSNAEAIEGKLNRFAENITEIQSNSLFLGEQLQDLHAIAEVSKGKLNETEFQLNGFTTKLDKYFDEMQQSTELMSIETSTKIEGVEAQINGSLQEIRKKHSDIEELLTVSEKSARKEIMSLKNVTNAVELQSSNLQRQIIDNHQSVKLLRLNLSNQLIRLQDGYVRKENEMRRLGNEFLDLKSTTSRSLIGLEKVNANLTSIWKKFDELHENMHVGEEKLGRSAEETNQTMTLIHTLKTEMEGMGIKMETTRSSVQKIQEVQNVNMKKTSMRISSVQQELSSLRESTEVKLVDINERMTGLEMANISLHGAIQGWIDEVNAVKGGIKSLREAEQAVSTALSSYQSTITKHDNVQRNLTKISKRVHKTLKGHGVALKSIQDIMNNLNQTWSGAELVDEGTYAEKLSSQGEEISAMRSLMQNFSSLLSEVLNDQLSHGVVQVSLGARQKSIVERLDSSIEQIDEMKRQTRQNTEKIVTVETSLTTNSMHFQSIADNLKNYSRILTTLGRKERELEKMIVDLNSTQLASRRERKLWISNFQKQFTKFETMQHEAASLHEDAVEAITSLSRKLIKINDTALFFTDELNIMKTHQKAASLNFEESAKQVETIGTKLADLNTTTVEAVLSLAKSVSQSKDSLMIFDHVIRERISNISFLVRGLQQKASTTQRHVYETTTAVAEIDKRTFKLDETLTEIRDVEIQRMNKTITTHTLRLDGAEAEIELHASELQSLRGNTSYVFTSINKMTDNLIDQEIRMKDFLKLDLEQASKKDTNELWQMLDLYQTNVSEIEGQMHMLSRNVDYNYNSTQLIFDLLDGQEERMTLLHDESSTLIPSITASIGNLDYSLGNMNASVRHHINDLKNLLSDFQAEFDTSNKQIARFADEFNVVKTNSSNQFSHLSATTEYLSQIVHGINKALDENMDRVDAINETVLALTLAVPISEDTDEAFADDSLEEPVSSFSTFKGNSLPYQTILDKLSTGMVDEERAKSLVTDLFEENDDNGVNYFENYDLPPQKRKGRVARVSQRMDKRVTQMVDAIESIQTSVYRIGNRSESLWTLLGQPSPKGAVAFSAGLRSDFACCGVVVFNNVYINSGNGYDDLTGKFTAPENGIYAFFISVAERNSFVRGALIQNGMSLVAVQLDHTGHYEQSQSSNFVILYLPVGTQIWVQIFAGTLQSYQSPTVTFSGFLLSRVN